MLFGIYFSKSSKISACKSSHSPIFAQFIISDVFKIETDNLD